MADHNLAIIVGVGPGLGGAISRRFAAAGHPVAMAARSTGATNQIAAQIEAEGGQAKGYVTDATNETSVVHLFDAAEADFGPPGVVVFCIGGRTLTPFLEIETTQLEQTWRNGCLSAFFVGREAARRMMPQGEGSIFFTGAPVSRRGSANNVCYAVAKFGVRGMAESMARELWPKGIHVAHFTPDGGVANERRVSRDPALAAEDGLISIKAIAETYYQTHLQPRSAWSFDCEVRPWNRAF
jgi:NAD(P)-dependent dehydrogenase (short-subunit alcohol dehydrogenase family)